MKKLVSVIVFNLLLCLNFVQAQDNKITGAVTDADNAVLPGVNVLVSGSSQGTVTDSEGKYVINAPAGGSLVFSFIGYVSQTVQINNRSVIDLQLTQESKILNEVASSLLVSVGAGESGVFITFCIGLLGAEVDGAHYRWSNWPKSALVRIFFA